MGDMFRTEKMTLCQLFIQPEAAYASVAALGEKGCVQFRDLNEGVTAFQRKFVNEVRRCDEMERQMRYIEAEITKDEIKIPELYFDELPDAPNPREIIDLEANLEKTEVEVRELAANELKIKTNHLELIEMRTVLEKTEGFFSEQEVIDLDINRSNIKTNTDGANLAFVAGVINRERVFAFERMLWRMSRGNVFLKQADMHEQLKDPITGNVLYKTVFVAFFQGEHLKQRVKKVCAGFHAAMYPCPSSHEDRIGMLKGVRTRIDDIKIVIQQSEDHRSRVLNTAAKHINTWTVMVKKMKAIYHTLNCFNIDVTEKCLIGEGWVPTKDMPTVQQCLLDGSSAVGSTVPSFLNVLDSHEAPPSYIRTNKFTNGFQNLIDSYGLSSYREVNPALYTCITFPFLFAVMFGDLGHGFCMFLFGLSMVIYEKKLGRQRRGEILNIMFSGRYIIMLMGLFACYTGFTYNDIFSKSLNVFGSKWRIRYNTTTVLTNPTLQLNPEYATVGVYPWGLDPIWQLADDNQIIFTNSYKMKLSVIFGVLHMIFGLCLSVENFIYFKRYSSIFLEFLPQALFLLLLFGYMVFMMFFKWVKYSATSDIQSNSPACAPSVLITFIKMMLFGEMTALPGCDAYMFSGQAQLEKIFVIVAVVCIPWILLGKPFWIMFTRRNNKTTSYDVESIDEDKPSESKAAVAHGEPEEEPMSEIFIHQAIHTIEYVLSTISHTASYLRLWALSLAHAELSQVLWNMVLRLGLTMNSGYIGIVAVFFLFGFWTLLTIAIMIMMEGLSAFLHTLRLHWVEFMSKFYSGEGYAFQPFSFKILIESNFDD
ncbi:V-type proton ATPase 116 kDa subunit a1-like [Teleopsis dalmanni]|uniref:V-type proton ATPase 116 kDa subunit a1-like n=1 Tax=Teleopsis dalmanni TaxID=139649 RepID=UPI000D32A749|nr:V-type proton ATPase 116 kDa subunit a1-like [Teleopsis dalmanni]XP_037950535.1 V-type proton ATPase 116 kDa subunit a1-like [Teleopsis dalmanni]